MMAHPISSLDLLALSTETKNVQYIGGKHRAEIKISD